VVAVGLFGSTRRECLPLAQSGHFDWFSPRQVPLDYFNPPAAHMCKPLLGQFEVRNSDNSSAIQQVINESGDKERRDNQSGG
jgi:hypothetical protein